MVRAPITPVHTCAVCGKPTSRLLGFAALVNLTDDGGGSRASRHTAVFGTCAAHRDLMSERFASEATAKGEVAWMCDEPVPLRPAQVADWYAEVDRFIVDAGINAGVLPLDAYIPIASPDRVPQDCPHCGGELSWGTGPHVADAAARGGALAWECPDCRAAGIFG